MLPGSVDSWEFLNHVKHTQLGIFPIGSDIGTYGYVKPFA